MHEASQGQLSTAEMRWMEPIFQTQEQISAIPQLDELLIETWRNRDGYHLFCYPFEGRMVHEGLAALVALRLSKFGPVTFSITMNDYGFLLLSKDFAGWTTEHFHRVFTLDGLEQDILSTLNATEMAKRQFKEVARIAGLVFQGYPGQRKQSRHVQASSNMFYEVFEQYDPENLLLKQTKKEVLDLQLQFDRLQAALQRILVSRPLVQALDRPSPFGFGLIVDRLRERVSSETLEARVQRMLEDYDKPHRNRKANSR
jgi:ATP-dependent Lhr-like helicase